MSTTSSTRGRGGRYLVAVAHPMACRAGRPVDYKVTMPGVLFSHRDIATAVAGDATVVCDRCGDDWFWCPDLRDPVAALLPAARRAHQAARARSAVR